MSVQKVTDINLISSLQRISLKLTATQLAAVNDVTPVYYNDRGFALVQATVRGTGALTCTLGINVSLNGVDFFELTTLVANGTGEKTAGLQISQKEWPFLFIKQNILTGTGAKVDVWASPNILDGN